MCSEPADSVLSAQGPQGEILGGLCFFLILAASMRTIIYIDGFNLYFRLLEKRHSPCLKLVRS
jgi:hypothetical protein